MEWMSFWSQIKRQVESNDDNGDDGDDRVRKVVM